MKYRGVKVIAVHRCGQRYIHVHWRQYWVHRVLPGGWEGGLLTALPPHGGGRGTHTKTPQWGFKKRANDPPRDTPQIHTIGRMTVIYTTLEIMGYLFLWKYFALFPVLRIVAQLTTPENTITYHNTLRLSPKILHKHCLQFLLGVKKAPRETENNAYAKFWGDKQRVLW